MLKHFKYIFTLPLLISNIALANQKSSSKFEEEMVGGQPVYISKTQNKDWHISLVTLGGYGSAFNGSKKNAAVFLPSPLIQYKNLLQFSLTEIKVNAISVDGFTAGTSLGWTGGRTNSIDEKMLDGMEDISVSGLAGIFAFYQYGGFVLYGDAKYNFSAGINSPVSRIALSYSQALSSNWILTGTISTDLAGKKYINKWFGVTDKESERTGLSKYEVSNSINIVRSSFGLSVSHILTKKLVVAANGEYHMLGSKARSSSLVKERGRDWGFSTMLAFIYTF